MSKTHAMLEKLGPRIEESLGKRGRTRPQVVELSRQPDPYAGRSRSTNAATIDLDRIIADEQHRERFDEAETASLAESLKSSGLLQPIVVRWDQQRARYVIIAGERRYRAARLAGLERVECVVKPEDITPAEIAEMQLAENFARQDLNPIELAQAFQDVIAKSGGTARDLARRLGVNETTVTRHLRLLKLPADIQQRVAKGTISLSVAREVARLDDEASQRQLLRRAEQRQLTSDDVAAAVAKGKIKQGRKHSSSKRKKLTFPSPHATITVTIADRGATYHHIEEALQQALEEVQHRVNNRVALL